MFSRSTVLCYALTEDRSSFYWISNIKEAVNALLPPWSIKRGCWRSSWSHAILMPGKEKGKKRILSSEMYDRATSCLAFTRRIHFLDLFGEVCSCPTLWSFCRATTSAICKFQAGATFLQLLWLFLFFSYSLHILFTAM